MKGKDLSLSNNNLTVKVSSNNNCQSILCMETIPSEGTHTLTATHASIRGQSGSIGVAKRCINTNKDLEQANAWSYYTNSGRKYLNGSGSAYG